MKSLFFLALIAFAVTASAQLETTCSQGYGKCQGQQHMNTCKAFLQQCGPMATPFVQSKKWQASSCQMMQRQCCQHLRQISQQSRCQAICGVTRAIMQHHLGKSFYQPLPHAQYEIKRMVMQTLSSMCNVYIPDYCTTTPCNIPLATSCVGGAC